jgi:hypothetical protein
MKTKILLIIIVLSSQFIFSQTMKVVKTDLTSTEFTLADVDSIKITTSSTGAMISSTDWVLYACNSGQSGTNSYTIVEDGIKLYGNGNNNSILLQPAYVNSIVGKTVYLQWKANGYGQNVDIAIELCDKSVNALAAINALNLSTKQASLTDNTWYYTRVSINNGSIMSVTAKNNYDNSGGQVLSIARNTIITDVNSISFNVNSGSESYAIIAEPRIE